MDVEFVNNGNFMILENEYLIRLIVFFYKF